MIVYYYKKEKSNHNFIGNIKSKKRKKRKGTTKNLKSYRLINYDICCYKYFLKQYLKFNSM